MTRTWTDRMIAELRRLDALDLTLALQAAHLGVSMTALKKARKRYGLTDRQRSAERSAARRRGVPRSPELKARLSAMAKARWADPVSRAKIEPGFLRGREATRAGKHALTRRGFPVPPEHRAEYAALQKKGLSASEAAQALGFLPEGVPVRSRGSGDAAPLEPARLRRCRTPRGVIGAAARHHGVSVADILSDARRKPIVDARHHAIVLLGERFPDLSSVEIGRVLSLDHTTVLYARERWPRVAHLHTIPFARRILEA